MRQKIIDAARNLNFDGLRYIRDGLVEKILIFGEDLAFNRKSLAILNYMQVTEEEKSGVINDIAEISREIKESRNLIVLIDKALEYETLL